MWLLLSAAHSGELFRKLGSNPPGLHQTCQNQGPLPVPKMASLSSQFHYGVCPDLRDLIRLKDNGSTRSSGEILGELPDLRDTQTGKDLIAIGERVGMIKGERDDLTRLLTRQFGALRPTSLDDSNNSTTWNRLIRQRISCSPSNPLNQLKW